VERATAKRAAISATGISAVFSRPRIVLISLGAYRRDYSIDGDLAQLSPFLEFTSAISSRI
jgi:hypothetical protein